MTLGRILGAVALLQLLLIARFFYRPTVPELPSVALGAELREEGCLACHAATEGIGEGHAAIGCSPCHMGNPRARDADSAHRGMHVLAGDLSIVPDTCGMAPCHAEESARVRTSLMAKASGILAVDRFAFGERSTPDGAPEDALDELDSSLAPASAAESHVRQLCAGCHLGVKKERPGDLGDAARGGGCTACHLAPPAPGSERGGAVLHPEVSARVPKERCTGCHSRSGRIALSYYGIAEVEPGDPRVAGTLIDGRPYARTSDDVHARVGMGCIDCHTERELMGDGRSHRHADSALDIACVDCHLPGAAKHEPNSDREGVGKRLKEYWLRRGLSADWDGPPLHTRRGTPLPRTDATTRTLRLADTGTILTIPEAERRPYHTLKGHERLSCSACHSRWAPRCGSCHMRFDADAEAVDHLTGQIVTGAWIETAGQNDFGLPLLALDPGGEIAPFIEGMDLVIENVGGKTLDRTLFAPLEPHTTGAARACRSCHAEPDSIEVYPEQGDTTRSQARLLDASERRRVARVGQCLECHSTYEDAIYRDFTQSVQRLGDKLAGHRVSGAVRACLGK